MASLSVITAHHDRNLAFSLKELRAWNFLQSSAAFPQYGKGVDNVNDTAGASVGNSGRATSMTMTTTSIADESKHHRRIERSCFLLWSKIRKVRQDLSDSRSLYRRDGNAFYRLSARANGFQRSLFLSTKRLVRQSIVRFHALFRNIEFWCRLVSSKLLSHSSE